MASVLPQQPQSMPGGGATDRLLESFTLAEQGGHAFLAEDGPAGSIVYTTVFLQDEEGDEVEIEDHQMLQRLQAALNNASSSATLSGATTATASSSASSDSGAAADGDEKDACEWTCLGICMASLDSGSLGRGRWAWRGF